MLELEAEFFLGFLWVMRFLSEGLWFHDSSHDWDGTRKKVNGVGGIENHNNNGSVPPFFSLLSVCSLGVGRRLVADLCEYESGMGQGFFLLLLFFFNSVMELEWDRNVSVEVELDRSENPILCHTLVGTQIVSTGMPKKLGMFWQVS